MPASANGLRVLVLANFDKSAARALAAELEPWLAERVGEVRLEGDIRAFSARVRAASRAERAAERPDLLVVLGGDGALLGALRAFARDPVPAVGIHLGRVGFLASTLESRWRDTLESVLAGDCDLEQRMRLEVSWRPRGGEGGAGGREEQHVALNDVTLQRHSREGMLRLSLSVDGIWVTNYRADGLIVATPSGSTAYALSAGGPILEPAVNGLVVTPICSQGLSNRPIVLHGDGELETTLVTAGEGTTVAIDGQDYFPVAEGDTLRVARHPVPYPLYAMPGLDPYRRLRERLGWGWSSLEDARHQPDPSG